MKTAALTLLLSGLLLLILPGFAADEPPLFHRVGDGDPVTSLPEYLVAAPGKVSLLADFSDRRGDWVVLYLVNRTPELQHFPTQDGDPYIKLEYQSDDGGWERAQPHQFSFCGNSYISASLESGEFFRFLGHAPASGIEKTVRFRSYANLDLISNVGNAFVRAADIEKARVDEMARRHVPLTLAASFPNGRRLAGLGDPQPERMVASLELLHAFDTAWYYRSEVERWLEENRSETPLGQDRREQIAAAERILARDWSHRLDHAGLFQRSVAAITAAEDSRPPLSPEADRRLVWCLLQELVYGSPHGGTGILGNNYAYHNWKDKLDEVPDERTRRALVAEAIQVLKSGPDDETAFAASIIASGSIGGDLVQTSELAKWCADPRESVWRWAAVGLIKRDEKSPLFDIVGSRGKEERHHVLWMLCQGETEDFSKKDRAFIDPFVRECPGRAATALRRRFSYKNQSVPARYGPALRGYLEKETAHPVNHESTHEGEHIRSALEIVAEWDDPADTPLITSFLNHPQVSRSHASTEDSKWEVVHSYTLRIRAQQLLEERGAPIPEGVIYKEVIGVVEEIGDPVE